MMSKKYYDLTNNDNDISTISIRKKDQYECQIVDTDWVEYSGFKLHESPTGSVFVLCDISFHIWNNGKYQPRIIFRKTNKEFDNKEVSKNEVIISFQDWKHWRKNFRSVISLLDRFNDLIELDWFDKYFAITEESTSDFLKHMSEIENRESMLEIIKTMETSELDNIEDLVTTTRISKIIALRETNKENDNEEFRQKIFQDNPWILSQIFCAPFIQIWKKFYCWWKEDTNKWWVLWDLMYWNELSGTMAFIEIKTPSSKIIGGNYRWKDEGAQNLLYTMDKDISWWIIQVLNQKKVYMQTYPKKNGKSYNHIKCILIVWKLPENTDELKSFELYRNATKEVEIITYDELFKRIWIMMEMFDKVKKKKSEVLEEDELPF